jgi:hypothetical protein
MYKLDNRLKDIFVTSHYLLIAKTSIKIYLFLNDKIQVG